jgi:NTE family protein
MTIFGGRPPDVLVLGGGGLLGEAWMTGVLAGIEDATGADMRSCRAYVGTSAGSIVSASLAAGNSPRRPRQMPAPDRPVEDGSGQPSPFAAVNGEQVLAGLLVPAGFASTAVGAPVRAMALRALPEGRISNLGFGRDVDRWGASFQDGRLRLCAVDQDSGRRMVFGSRGAPDATVGQAVAASCAIPGVFRPVPIGGRRYVDGGAWSPTNGDAAPAGRRDRVLLLEPMAVLLRGMLRGAAALEALALRSRGSTVHAVVPDASAARLMKRLMDPDHGGRVLAAGYRQGLDMAR